MPKPQMQITQSDSAFLSRFTTLEHTSQAGNASIKSPELIDPDGVRFYLSRYEPKAAKAAKAPVEAPVEAVKPSKRAKAGAVVPVVASAQPSARDALAAAIAALTQVSAALK